MNDDKNPGGSIPHFVAYVYPGWHRDPYRPGIDEWKLLDTFQPYFPGHSAPPNPLNGPYDDADPDTAMAQIRLASSVGIEVFMYFLYYGPSNFVMCSPMTNTFEASAQLGIDFAIAGTWCIRLPHDRFPVPARDEIEQPPVPSVAPGTALEDTPIELLTLRDLETLLASDASAWSDIKLGSIEASEQSREVDSTSPGDKVRDENA